jgi:hypothetical protein
MSSAQDANPTSLVPFEQDNTPTTLPPPYTSPTSGEEDGDADDEDYIPQPPTSVHINASTTIRGSYNVVTSMPYESIHLTAAVMAGLQQHTGQAGATNYLVRIDRSVNIVGDRNVVGPWGLRPRQPVAANAAMAARVAAAAAVRKRKAEEENDSAPEAKRASARAKSCPPA